jgi:hypothetical protein
LNLFEVVFRTLGWFHLDWRHCFARNWFFVQKRIKRAINQGQAYTPLEEGNNPFMTEALLNLQNDKTS